MASSPPPALPIYSGDDANDADALEAAAALGGIAIGIGVRAPATATHRLPSPRDLLAFHETLLASLPLGPPGLA